MFDEDNMTVFHESYMEQEAQVGVYFSPESHNIW